MVKNGAIEVGSVVMLCNGLGTVQEITPDGFAKGVTEIGTGFHMHTGNIRLAEQFEIDAYKRRAEGEGQE